MLSNNVVQVSQKLIALLDWNDDGDDDDWWLYCKSHGICLVGIIYVAV